MSSQQGFGLIEAVTYIALLAVIALAVSGFVFQLVRFNARAQATAQALDDARRAMAIITYETRHAVGVYNPTSSFGTHPGQLSLETTRQAPTGETSTYIDFYVDGERLAVKRESQPVQLITSEGVKVTSLVFTQLDGASPSPTVSPSPTPSESTTAPNTVRVQLTVEARGAATEAAVTLYSTASLRAYE